MKKKIFLFLLLLLTCIGFDSMSQAGSISGTIKDAAGNGIPGVSVRVKGTTRGTTSDIDGKYSIAAKTGETLQFSGVGLVSQEAVIGTSPMIEIIMSNDERSLGEVIVVGSRASQRSVTDSPLPVDILPASELKSTGQTTFDKALQYRVPSFNTINTPVNDATSLLDPYEIRNMGPSRTLILVNGKRKNLSSLVYIQTSPGRGETGADISAIPTDAIKRVEILRDGASAQYGSDAIAGVMNIILKDRYEYGSVTLNTGITHKGDGKHIGVSLNNGSNLANNGFINYTINLSNTTLANRSNVLNAQDEADYWGVPVSVTQAFLAKKPDGGHMNASPATAAAKFLMNGAFPLSNKAEMYFNGAYVYKKVNSFANYRTPYWKSIADNPSLIFLVPSGKASDYMGYVPSFDGDLNDYNGTIGFRSENNGWKSDVSFTTGGNKQLYTVANTVNFDLGFNTPTTFKPGGYNFRNNVGNIDISKALTDKLGIAFGSEFRAETFQIIGGDTSSYAKGGANSFPGINQNFATTNTRFNLGGYVDLAYDITKNFYLNGTFRTEKYSDFGNANVWKLSTRLKAMDDKLVFRASASTGFRAPTLHQLYLKVAQASFIDGTIKNSGLFPNGSKEANAIGIEQLKPEKSFNFTFGVGVNPNRNTTLTLDYYNITVNDRIILTSTIKASSLDTKNAAGKELLSIMNTGGIAAIQFFTNGVNTRTSGIDLVANRRNIEMGSGKIGLNLAANYTLENKLLKVTNPSKIAAAGQSIFDKTQEGLMLTSRPKYKAILGVDYSMGKFSVNLNNTLFGPTEFRQGDFSSTTDLKTVFKPRVLTDLGFNWEFAKNTVLGVNVQNLFNVLPKWEVVGVTDAGKAIVSNPAKLKNEISNITFNGRYMQQTYDGSHFSILGTTFAANLQFKF